MNSSADGCDGPEPPSPTSNIHIRPACDNCRVRKTRCDRQHPCSQCITAKIECKSIERKPRERRNRILVTPQYEDKVDRLDRRLGEVLTLLRSIKDSRQSDEPSRTTLKSSSETHESPASSSRRTPSDGAVRPGSSAILGVTGNSSLAAHSTFASDFMHQIAGETPLQRSGSEMDNNLEALSSVVTALREQTVVNEMTYPHARVTVRPSPSAYELPPIQKAVELLGMVKEQRLAGTGLIYEFASVRNFSDICLRVYFSATFSETDFIIVNAGLQSLFGDFSHRLSGEEKDAYLGHARNCRANLETALSNLPLHLPMTSEAASALLFGAWHTIELSKPYLSWGLSAKAAELIQTLGYHRLPDVDQSDDAKFKKFLLWTNYFLDKSLSLRLGRASAIPDWDITTRRPCTSDAHKEPAMAYFVLWVEAARCQGSIYETLYSPDAIAQPEHVRETRARLLLDNLRALEQATQETHIKWVQISKDAAGKDLIEFFAISDDILRLSLLTLVHRAAPRQPGAPTTFSGSCIEAARATLRKHQDCLAIIERSREYLLPIYVHWTLLFAPFIPFIVIFCRTIETNDQTDLDLLGTFAASIQPAAAASDAAAKLHRLFQTLHTVAARYLELFNSYDQNIQATEEMEMYLRLLGASTTGDTNGNENGPMLFSHNTGEHLAGDRGLVTGEPMLMNPMLRMGHGVQLEEWFYNNQALMESFQAPVEHNTPRNQ